MINIMRDGCLKPPASHDTSEIPSHLNIFEFKPVRFAEAHLGDESARLEVSLWGGILEGRLSWTIQVLEPWFCWAEVGSMPSMPALVLSLGFSCVTGQKACEPLRGCI
jgi:hypothetical protein